MNPFHHDIEAALLAGDWGRLERDARAWVRAVESTGEKDPRPYFALNILHLIRGNFPAAWKLHAQALQEADDIALLRYLMKASKRGKSRSRIGFTSSRILSPQSPVWPLANSAFMMSFFLAGSFSKRMALEKFSAAVSRFPRAA